MKPRYTQSPLACWAGLTRTDFLKQRNVDESQDWFEQTRLAWSRELDALEHELRADAERSPRPRLFYP